MNKVLVLFAHPVYQTSLLNKSLLAGLPNSEHVTLHDLYETYPNFMINVAREQALLESHDVIVFQHPMYWYSCPALLKEWMDLVLEHGYAYGTGATALKDKYFISSITSGGDVGNYEGEKNIRNLLQPFEFTANLCNMKFLPPFITYGGLKIKAGNFDQNLTTDYLTQQVSNFNQLIEDLIHDRIDPQACEQYATMNERFDLTEVSQ
ncbi:NAD(P)H-dependent oxidoreductase [Marinicella litoralis]|uniref:Kef-type potassium/proton antiporter accessory protein (CPA2 family) n=1 Tax=Marinicella litoralis TaxID=644220 RepID=A0A4R6XK18_9GAMM|nr:NAD(P)H-dependent oxidoreductase [Marinicella litoralis]TDR18300.1 Kef-type potassium/proton antiporter accessory protein (CPA2 family) [Marinicella litoralis]